jgi:hypothetical protein
VEAVCVSAGVRPADASGKKRRGTAEGDEGAEGEGRK